VTSSDRSGRVAGVVLAAGSSSRLGSNKLLIDIGGESVVRRAAGRALEAGLSPVIAVIGFEADQVAGTLQGLDVILVVNPDHAVGMHSSVRAGIGRVPVDCEAAVVILADMPLVTSAMSADLVARFRAGSEPLVISIYGAVQAPPTLYSRALFPALGAAGEGCGRRVVRAHRGEAATLEWLPSLLADLDRPDDVERVRALGPE
jgi:molybdenum cofactor cytidylyltransferase